MRGACAWHRCFLDRAPCSWFERVSMLVILLNCVTLGMFHPCEDIACDSPRCRILQVWLGTRGFGAGGLRDPSLPSKKLPQPAAGAHAPRPAPFSSRSLFIPLPFLWQSFDDFIFAFFAVEMIVKMIALGIFGKKCYLGDTWNRLDFFIVIAG